MRFFLLSLLLSAVVFAKNDIDKKISQTHSQLTSFSKNYTRINKKMARTAREILRQKVELEKQNRYLAQLQKELKTKEKSYKTSTLQLKELQKVQNQLKSQQEKIEEKLVFLIAQSVSLSLILEQNDASNEDALIEFEVLESMLAKSKQKIKKLNETFYTNAKDISILGNQSNALKSAINAIDAKRKKLIATQKAHKKALKKLTVAKASYKKELKKLLKKQDALKHTLAQLNIIKVDAIKKAQQEKERKEAFARRQTEITNLPKVKKKGSSYQSVKTKRYTGAKTIAPLRHYTITKKYGTYTDPIYGIKIFNESISLKPTTKDNKVRTVFNGKVIYADKTAVLDNIVIVEHRNGLHTIYANLSQISPNIRKGKKIKKGYTIGRVNDELIFEVTQKSYHINPIRLFK